MFKKVRKRYDTLKWVLWIVFFMVLLSIATSVYLSSKFKPLIKAQIKELALRATDSLYRIEFSDVKTNFLTGGASLSDVQIIPDTAIYKKLITLNKAPNNIYDIRLKKLSIKNFHPLLFLKHKRLIIDLLLFDHPDVIMVNKQFLFNEGKRGFPEKSPYEYISSHLSVLRVKTIAFRNMRFIYINNNRATPEVDSVKNLDITLKDWLIDQNSAKDHSRMYLLKDIAINLKDYSYATPDSMYFIKLNQFDFAASSGILKIKSFSVVPRYSEMKFGQVARYARDRFDILMSDINLEGIDLPLYIRRQELYATEMSIANGYVKVFNNNSLPRKEVVRTGQYPHQLLQKLKGILTVRQLNLNNVAFSYAEFDKSSRQKGELTFEKTSGSITNISNAAWVKTKSPYMFAHLNSYLMGKGKLDVNFKFDLNAKDGQFTYAGSLGTMDGREFNRITKPLGMVEVNRGKVKKLIFDIDANDRLATGAVSFAFNDLSVGLLKKEKGAARLVKKGLISMLANAMVINSDNPNKQGVWLSRPIHYERQKTASFFSFIWRTLFQGIKHSVGVTEQKQQQIKAQILKFEKMKSDRKKRKAVRQKRRALQDRTR